MNKDRRKRVQEVVDLLEQAKETLSALAEEEQEAFENLPESLQDTDNGEAMTEAAETLESAESDVDEVMTTLKELVGDDN